MFGWTRDRDAQVNAVLVRWQSPHIRLLSARLIEMSDALDRSTAQNRELSAGLSEMTALCRRQSNLIRELQAGATGPWSVGRAHRH